MTDPTDPAKALEAFVETRAAVRERIDELLAKEQDVRYRDCGENSRTVALARALLASAPALLAALARIEKAEGLLRDFAEHGLRADLNPSYAGKQQASYIHAFYGGYLKGIEANVRERASAFLAPAPASGDAEEATRG